MKLTEPQRALLSLCSGKPMGVDFYDAAKIGARGPTLAAMVRFGLLRKHTYPDTSNAWFITEAGKSLLRGQP